MDYAGSSTAENSKSKKTDATKIYSKKTNNNNPKQGGSKTKPL